MSFTKIPFDPNQLALALGKSLDRDLVHARHALRQVHRRLRTSGNRQGSVDARWPGTLLTRAYKGQTLQVQVLAEGFAFEGKFYDSLSAVARAITGSHCSGYLFFRLGRKGGSR